jgi:integrase
MQTKSLHAPKHYVGCTLTEDRGVLRLRYRWQGKQWSKSLGVPATVENRATLEPLQRLVGDALDRGRDPAPLIAECLRLGADTSATLEPPETVVAYYNRWIAQQVPPLVRRAQARDYRRHLTGYVLPVLGSVLLVDLTASDLRGLQSELLTSGRPRVPDAAPPRRGTPSRHLPLSVKTVRNILGGSLRAMLRQARKDGLLTRERFADLMDLEWPKGSTPEPDPFTAEERTRLLAWFATRTFRVPAEPGNTGYILRLHLAYHVYLHLLFWSGMRPSEAAGLQWYDMDLERGTAEVRRSRHLWTYGEPKTAGARRTVQLFPETVRLLRALQPLRVEPTTPVFSNTRGTPIEPNSLLPHWYAAQRALGLRVRGLYSTKDTFVTTALDAGVKIAWLETQTGVNYLTLRRHYGKWMPSDGGRELERFASLDPTLFGGGIVPDPASIVPEPRRRKRKAWEKDMRKGS